MSAHALVLLDSTSSLQDAVKSLFANLFTVQNAIIALVLTFVFAILGWLIAYFILRKKEVCSMVCSVHFSLVILTILAGLFGALSLIDRNQGSLITGAGFSLLALTIPIFILVESFNYVVLSNKHARRHRDLRTPADKRVRRMVVFLTPLLLGVVLVGVGLLVGTASGPVTELVILLLTLWVLAVGAEIIFLARSRQRRARLAAMASGGQVNQAQLAALWVGGIASYRIGRGRTEAVYWEEFTERVVVTEELLLEEEGELDLVKVEEQETISYAAVAVAAGGTAAGTALHRQHRLQRHEPANRFFRRWGTATTLFAIFIVATAICAITSVSLLITLAFLAPVIYLVIYRVRRDNDVRFATETVEKINTVQAAAVVTGVRRDVIAERIVEAPPRPSSAPPGLRPTRPTPVIPPAEPPLILPKEEPEPPTLPSAERAEATSEEAVAAGQAHENPDISEETILFPGRAAAAGQAHENPDVADDTLLIAHTPATPEAEEESADAQFERYFHGVAFPATRGQLLAAARKNRAPRSLIIWLETLSVSVTFVTLVEVIRRYSSRRTKEEAAASAEQAKVEEAAAVPRTRSGRISSRIGIIEFQHYLHGIDYPATREQLLERARANNAPPNMIARLEELEEHYEFLNVSDVMLGYAYHRFLRGAHFPATKAELLEHARANSAPPKLLTRLEALDESATFASLPEVLRRSHAGQAVEEVEEVEEEDDDDEAGDEDATLVVTPATKADSRIRITDFQHHLHGITYPANREQLVERARANNAPPNMIARLEELPEHHQFKSASEVMRGYAHRVEDDAQ